MEKLITNAKNIFKTIALTACLGWGQMSLAQNNTSLKLCDASFQDASKELVLPAIGDWNLIKAFRAQEGYKTYVWDFGDGIKDSSSHTFIRHDYTQYGYYNVTLKVYRDATAELPSCEDKQSLYVYVGPRYELNCGDRIQKTIEGRKLTVKEPTIYNIWHDTTIFSTKKWEWGDGTFTIGKDDNGLSSVEHEYSADGMYKVSLTTIRYKKPENCAYCKIMPLPIDTTVCSFEVKIGNVPYGCKSNIAYRAIGQNVKFSDNLAIDYFENHLYFTHTWDFGDGTTAQGRNVDHYYSETGTYQVRLIKQLFKDPCPPSPSGIRCLALPYVICSDTQIVSVHVRSDNSLCLSKIDTKANGLKVEFRELHSLPETLSPYVSTLHLDSAKYLVWEFGDGTALSGPVVSHEYASPGTYKVKLTKTVTSYSPIYYTTDTIAYPFGRCFVPGKVICQSVTEFEVTVTGNEPKCKSFFTTSIIGDKVSIKSAISGEHIGYAKLDYGDGDFVETAGTNLFSTHTYSKPGTYDICLRIATVPDSILPFVLLTTYCTDTYCKTVTVKEGEIKEVTTTGFTPYTPENYVITKAYPNPAQNTVNFQINNATAGLTLRLYDAAGTVAKEVQGLQNGMHTIDIQQLENGIYFYSFSADTGVVDNGKIVVQK